MRLTVTTGRTRAGQLGEDGNMEAFVGIVGCRDEAESFLALHVSRAGAETRRGTAAGRARPDGQ